MKTSKETKQDNYDGYFPQTLRNMIKKYNLTQQALGEGIGVTRQAISQYQNGDTTPDIYTFKKIVDFFNEKFDLNYSADYWLGNINIEQSRQL